MVRGYCPEHKPIARVEKVANGLKMRLYQNECKTEGSLDGTSSETNNNQFQCFPKHPFNTSPNLLSMEPGPNEASTPTGYGKPWRNDGELRLFEKASMASTRWAMGATTLIAAPRNSNDNCDRIICAAKAYGTHTPVQSSGLRCAPPHLLVLRRERIMPRTFTFGVWAISTNEFKTGTNIELDGAPYKVLEFLHVKPGKGAAFVRTKLKNYVTGNTVDKTFRAGEQVPVATVQKDFKQFSYMDGDQFVFMDMETFEEARLSARDVGDRTKFLKEGMECSVLTWNDKVIDMDLPVTVKLKVTQADPGVKGDTAQGGSKLVTVETGAQVTVPLFVSQDDTIVIQTKDGSYISRA